MLQKMGPGGPGKEEIKRSEHQKLHMGLHMGHQKSTYEFTLFMNFTFSCGKYKTNPLGSSKQ